MPPVVSQLYGFRLGFFLLFAFLVYGGGADGVVCNPKGWKSNLVSMSEVGGGGLSIPGGGGEGASIFGEGSGEGGEKDLIYGGEGGAAAEKRGGASDGRAGGGCT